MADIWTSIRGKAILAPLAGITNLPFRLIVRELGCALAFTEMISASGLTRESVRTIEYLATTPDDRPLGVQIFGADPEIMAKAAATVSELSPDVIDINMGCPVRKVVKSGSGAALMKTPALAGRIIASVVKASAAPVTVKIRAGWTASSMNAPEIARIAESEGAQAVIVHGRTANQGFSGHADWRIIADVRQSVGIPVIGNGDIRRPADAARMIAQTGCHAVMVGRGALGNPWIFQGMTNLSEDVWTDVHPSLPDRECLMLRHWKLEESFYGDRIAERRFRKHLLWYTKGLPGSGRFRERVGRMKNREDMQAELKRYFASLQALPAEIMT